MDPLYDKLKALKPDEPDDEIEKDLASARKAGLTDDQIYAKAQALMQGGGNTPPPALPASPGGPGPLPVPPGAPPASPGGLPPTPPSPTAPAGSPPDSGKDLEDIIHPSSGKVASMAALEGLAGLGDAISGSYGRNKTDFLKTAMGAEGNELAKREAVSKAVMEKAMGASQLKTAGLEQAAAEKSAADLKAAQDPTSTMSGIAQRANTPLLSKMGATPDQIAKMPASLIAGVVDKSVTLEDALARIQEAGAYQSGMLANTKAHQEAEDVNAKSARISAIDEQLAKMGKTGQWWNSDEAKSLQAERAKLAGGTGGAPAAPANLPTINSQADYDKLPSGAEYLAPDGSHKRKK